MNNAVEDSDYKPMIGVRNHQTKIWGIRKSRSFFDHYFGQNIRFDWDKNHK
jgi:hypothetical protein